MEKRNNNGAREEKVMGIENKQRENGYLPSFLETMAHIVLQNRVWEQTPEYLRDRYAPVFPEKMLAYAYGSDTDYQIPIPSRNEVIRTHKAIIADRYYRNSYTLAYDLIEQRFLPYQDYPAVVPLIHLNPTSIPDDDLTLIVQASVVATNRRILGDLSYPGHAVLLLVACRMRELTRDRQMRKQLDEYIALMRRKVKLYLSYPVLLSEAEDIRKLGRIASAIWKQQPDFYDSIMEYLKAYEEAVVQIHKDMARKMAYALANRALSREKRRAQASKWGPEA